MIGVVIPCAGKGDRAGFSKNKLLVPFQGTSVLERTISAFSSFGVDEIVLSVSENDETEIKELIKKYPEARYVLGGKTRFESCYNAVKSIRSDIVLIHDGARPFVDKTTIQNCIDSVKKYGSGICAIPQTDTVAISENGKIDNVPDRTTVYSLQTPQGFFTKDILSAYEKAFGDGKTYTDDSSVYREYVGSPYLCQGNVRNKKMTFKEDFSEEFARCGFGVDTHAFGKAQDYITLAGIKIPSETGLIAHSDGDVLIHAVMDALLSSVGLKDIGYYFPDTDDEYKDADSTELLKKVIINVGKKP